jgi:hypothetical protein
MSRKQAAETVAFSEALKLILAGCAGGHLHILRLEEPKPKTLRRSNAAR